MGVLALLLMSAGKAAGELGRAFPSPGGWELRAPEGKAEAEPLCVCVYTQMRTHKAFWLPTVALS